MPDSVIKKFEEEYGIRVNYNTYSSNEEMLAKISGGAAGYDRPLPVTTWWKLCSNKILLEPIDKDNIANLEYFTSSFWISP